MDQSTPIDEANHRTIADTAFLFNADTFDGRGETIAASHRVATRRASGGALSHTRAGVPPATTFGPIGPNEYEKGDELQSKEWGLLEKGVYVLVERDKASLLRGEVDDLTGDASVIWIWLDGGRGRIALFDEEGTRVWLPKGYSLQAAEEVL
jgi:hypothetical protein